MSKIYAGTIALVAFLAACGNLKSPQDVIDDIRYFGHKEVNNYETVEQYFTVENVVEVIDPCGQETDFDEVILRLDDYVLLVYFQQGRNRRLSILISGRQYVTTDGTNCRFEVQDDGTKFVVVD